MVIRRTASLAALALVTAAALAQQLGGTPEILQHPALSRTKIVFGYAGDLWTVDRNGGKATRLTTGVGVETAPAFSPDGSTIAFTGDYDGNTDVFTIPASGGIPHRVTYHPANDFVVSWTPDGKRIVFRSERQASSRYTQLFTTSPEGGGLPEKLPLPMAYNGQFSPDGKYFAYSPLPPAFGFDYSNYVAWGNYRGGRASTVWIVNMQDLSSTEVPHERASDLDPVWLGGKVYFLSDRKGRMSLFSYDPASKSVTECVHNSGADIHSLSGGPGGLVYDQMGEIYLYDPANGKSHKVPIEVTGDLPEVRSRIENVARDIAHARISPTGVRALFEAHGEILTVPAPKMPNTGPQTAPTRDLTNTPGVMEREPAWSPDGQSIAFFSDESGLYALHIVSQDGAGEGRENVRKFPLENEADYYFGPQWSPDSKRIAFHDNRLNLWMLDTASGKLTHVGENDAYSELARDIAWSPDSKWLAYSRELPNHLHGLFLYSVDTGQSTPFTGDMADARFPAFDKNGKYLYFTVSTNYGGTSFGLDMTSDLLHPARQIYALSLAADTPSPEAPAAADENAPGAAAAPENNGSNEQEKPAEEPNAAASPQAHEAARPPAPPKPVKVDLNGIEDRVAVLSLPPKRYENLAAGKPGVLFFMEIPEGDRFGDRTGSLMRYEVATRKTDKIADRVDTYDLSANGEKVLLSLGPPEGEAPAPQPNQPPHFVIAAANTPLKPGEGVVDLAHLNVRVDPPAEWKQMYHEVWRIERAYFYDPNYHGVEIAADERKFEPYVSSIASRTDLNYIFQEMLGAFSIGHLRGGGGAIPEAHKVPGGLLGADYTLDNGHYCIAKIYTGAHWNPQAPAPLAQPGLNVKPGDCILAINGQPLTASDNIQRLLEGTAGQPTLLRIRSAGAERAITVVPVRSEASLRNIDWIEANRRKVDELSGGKLAYVYLPDTAAGGFTNFNRYYFAQLQKQGAVIDERFNAGGQVADYIIEALKRPLEAWWTPRYGGIERTPNAAIPGPKVMITNEYSGSGGDAMPWLFREQKLGPLVGKRTWGGLVGIGEIPVLMDGGHVTSPSFGFFSPTGQWDVENHGVEPDYSVEMDPKSVSEGHDPQLEKAVSLAMQELAAHPVPRPNRPAFPNYHNGAGRE